MTDSGLVLNGMMLQEEDITELSMAIFILKRNFRKVDH
jgi:hypothetical protein